WPVDDPGMLSALAKAGQATLVERRRGGGGICSRVPVDFRSQRCAPAGADGHAAGNPGLLRIDSPGNPAKRGSVRSLDLRKPCTEIPFGSALAGITDRAWAFGDTGGGWRVDEPAAVPDDCRCL